MIDIAKLFSNIESNEFAAKFGIASNLRMFIDMLDRDEVYQTLYRSLYNRKIQPESIIDRIKELVNTEFDYKYENPYDTALAVYLLILNNLDHKIGIYASQITMDVSQTWWARQVVNWIQGLTTIPKSDSFRVF